jgi:hypothetical protein
MVLRIFGAKRDEIMLRIFGAKRDEIIGWRKIHNKLHNLNFSPYTIRMIK